MAIKAALADGQTAVAVAAEFSVHHATVRNIEEGRHRLLTAPLSFVGVTEQRCPGCGYSVNILDEHSGRCVACCTAAVQTHGET